LRLAAPREEKKGANNVWGSTGEAAAAGEGIEGNHACRTLLLGEPSREGSPRPICVNLYRGQRGRIIRKKKREGDLVKEYLACAGPPCGFGGALSSKRRVHERRACQLREVNRPREKPGDIFLEKEGAYFRESIETMYLREKGLRSLSLYCWGENFLLGKGGDLEGPLAGQCKD